MKGTIKTLTVGFVMISVMLFSCSKKTDVNPRKIVTYTVECGYCTVYVEDNVWNRYNEQERSKNQHFNVNGKWFYRFSNSELEEATMNIVVSVTSGVRQEVKALIQTNNGKSVSYKGIMDYKNNRIELKLDLKEK